MERKELVNELKSVVNTGTVAVQKENAWMDKFLVYAVDSVDFSQEQSEASQAVAVFLSLCRDARLWSEKVTPLSFRRKCRKEGKEESPLVTTLCRLEGKIRDIFRLPRSNGNASNGNASNGNASNGNASNGNASNGNASDESAASSDISDTLKRKYRTEGKLIILGALKRWIEDSSKISKKGILAEIERMEEGLLKQEEAA